MGCIVRGTHVFAVQLRRVTETIRIPFVLLLVACFLAQNLDAVVQFSKDVGLNVTPYAFVHLQNDYVCQFVMMAGAVIIFCDAPFEDNTYSYMVTRSGLVSWSIGQMLYIVCLSFLYILFLLLFSVLPFIGHIEFSGEWGKIWGTLAKTDTGTQYGLLFTVSEYMVSQYEPVPALLESVILEWACIVWLGLFIYVLNKTIMPPIGTVAGAFVILLDICVSNDWMNWANKFSPITLAQLTTYTGWNLRYHVTLTYGIKFFAIGIPILILISFAGNERGKLRWCLNRCNIKRKSLK